MVGRVGSNRLLGSWAALAAAGIVGVLVGLVLALWLFPRGSSGFFVPPPTPPFPGTTTATSGLAAEPTVRATQALPGVLITPTASARAAATSTPLQPQPTTPTLKSVFGLAWFHKPPEDGTTAAEIAGADRYIHLTGRSDLPFRAELRAAGFAGPIYDYVSTNGTEGPDPSNSSISKCSYTRTPNDNNVAWSAGDFCRYINPHESWFLHNGKGQRLVDDYFGKGRWTYLMNPADPGWQAFSYQRLQQVHETLGYDGIWLDNLDLDIERLTSGVTNSDGTVREYKDDVQWRAAMKGWLSGLRSAVGTVPVWANLVGGGLAADSWDPYAPYLDGAMDESFAVSWLDAWRAPEEWNSQLERADRWLALGKGLVMVGQGAQNDDQRLDFTLASYLLVATGDEAFYRYTRFDSFYNQLWLYPQYDTARALGTPAGPRMETSPGIWRRQFTGGYTEVDLSQHTGRLVLQKP